MKARIVLLAAAFTATATIGLVAQDRDTEPRRVVRKPVSVVKTTPAKPEGPTDIQANVVECVDPPLGDPPVQRSASATATPRRAAKTRTMQVGSGRLGAGADEPVSFKSSAASTQLAPDPGTSCRARANYEFYREGMVLPSMPDVNFPNQPCQSRGRCIETTKAWLRTHYNVYIARLVIHHIAKQDHVEKRKYLWRQPGVRNGVKLGEETSPEYWFGPYSENRFRAVKEGIDDLWNILRTNKTGGINVSLECPTELQEPNNVCFSAKPAAHHWVKGHIDLCPVFYDAERSDYDKTRLMTHELMHHLWVKYGDIWVAIQDKHYHGHGLGCGLDPGSESHYGEDKILHLANYRNSKNNDCGHLARNVRNNDTYAYFITTMGDKVYRGRMTQWPAPADPTPQPPKCVGDEGCLCSDEETWHLAGYFEPDGDYSPEQWCDDHDGEMTCMATKFGATTKGICTKCDEVRGAGCECDAGRPCDKGSCFGDETFNGGVGRCFEDPPAWACLADCERLLNDDHAWCYAGYPTGQARCMDNLSNRVNALWLLQSLEARPPQRPADPERH